MSDKLRTHKDYQGIRYREKREGKRVVRHFYVRYHLTRLNKTVEEALGSSAEGWSLEKAKKFRQTLIEEQKLDPKNFQTLAERRKAAAEQQAAEEVAEAEASEQERREGITLGDVWSQHYRPWLEQGGVRHPHHDINRYRNLEHLAEMPMKDIDTGVVEKLRDTLKGRSLAPASVNHVLKLLRQIFNKARLRKVYQGASPFDGRQIVMEKVNNQRKRFITPEEEEAILEALAERSPLTRDLAVVSLYAGLRVSEITALRWQGIDSPEDDWLTVADSKSGKSRMVPIHPYVRKVLERYRKPNSRPGDRVFQARGGIQLTRISNTFSNVVKELGLNEGRTRDYHIVFHSLRHSFASRLVNDRRSLTAVRDLLGHKDFAMLSRYTHSAPDEMKAAVNGLGDAKPVRLVVNNQK